MKDKIFQKLKQEYSHLGLGKEVLQAQADALAATGIVTDENIDTIVSSQKSFLESIQKANDQRATEAQRKAKEDALKEYEAQKEKERVAAEEEAKRKELEKQMPDWYLKEKQASEDMLKKLAESNELLRKGLEAMQSENSAFKAEKAAAERKNLILSKAKELGIPEYRIKEGFSIAADADEASIVEHLTSVANNIKAFSLPSNKEAFPMSGPELKKEELDSIAKSLVV
jgi:hypothetical protein